MSLTGAAGKCIRKMIDSGCVFYATGSYFFGGYTDKSDVNFIADHNDSTIVHWLLLNDFRFESENQSGGYYFSSMMGNNLASTYKSFHGNIRVHFRRNVEKDLFIHKWILAFRSLYIEMPKQKRVHIWQMGYSALALFNDPRVQSELFTSGAVKVEHMVMLPTL